MWSSIVVLSLSACKKDDLVEDAPPSALAVESPLPAAFIPAGPTEVVGIATSLTDVTVNGEPATVTNGRFAATLDLPRGISTLEVRGVDPTGHTMFTRHAVLAGAFTPAEDRVAGAMELRLNQAGLDHLGSVLSGLLDPEELFTTMSASNPIYNYFEYHGLFVDNTDVDVNLTSITFDPLELDAAPLDDKLRIELLLRSPTIEMATYGTIAYLDDTNGDPVHISADAVHIAADVSLDVDGQGKVAADLSNVVVDLPNFEASWDYLWELVEWVAVLFLDLEVTVEELIGGIMTEQAPPLLGGVLSALTDTFDVNMLGTPVELDMRLTDIVSDPDGIRFLADLGVAFPDTLDGPGYLTAPPATPSPDPDAQLSLAISDDLANRAFYEAWSSGMIDLTLSTEDGSLEPVVLEPLGGTEGSIRVTAGLPPVIVERDGRLEAQLGEVAIHLETPGGTNGNTLDVTMSGTTALELSIVDHAIVIGLGEPELQFVVRDSDWGARNETITNVLEKELPIDVLLLLLGDFSIPLPELPGFTIASATTSRDASGSHTDVSITLQ
jgi:hypothetical protein